MKKEVVKVAAWRKKSLEFGVWSEELRVLPRQFQLNHLDVQESGALKSVEFGVRSVELPGFRGTGGKRVLRVKCGSCKSSYDRLADRSMRLPTFSWQTEVGECQHSEPFIRTPNVSTELNGRALQECQRSVSTPKYESANVRLALRSRRVPTFS